MKRSKLSNNEEATAVLSSRELEVLGWLKVGKTSWDIAMILGISERTVNYHVCNIIEKLGATNRTHAVSLAMIKEMQGIESR